MVIASSNYHLALSTITIWSKHLYTIKLFLSSGIFIIINLIDANDLWHLCTKKNTIEWYQESETKLKLSMFNVVFIFFLSKSYLFMFAVYFCVSKAIDSDSRFVIQILSILSFYVPDFNKHKPNRNQKKKTKLYYLPINC